MARSWMFVTIMVLSAASVRAQVTLQWYAWDDTGTLGFGVALAADTAGSVYVTGYSLGNTATHVYATVAYDTMTGDPKWTAQYDGGHGFSEARALAIDGLGTVYVTGTSSGGATGQDYATVAYDARTGSRLWAARYNGPGNSYDEARAIAVDGRGKVYVTGISVGATNFDYATVAYDARTGTQLWVARYQAPNHGDSVAYAIAVDRRGTVYVTGSSFRDATGDDYATVAYDAMTGAQLWAARYHGPGNGFDYASGIAADGVGSVYVTGTSDGGATGNDYATVAYDAMTGTQLWVARYNGPSSQDEQARALAIDSGGVYVTGQSLSGATGSDYATVAYTLTGTQLWVARYHGPVTSYDYGSAIAVDGQGTVYVTGTSFGGVTGEDYVTLAYDTRTGTQLWMDRFDGPAGGDDVAFAVTVDGLNQVYVTGTSVSGASTVAYSQP